MNYKKLIKNQKIRIAILNYLSFIPDKQMIQLQYKIKTGKKLNLENPKRYTEKLQWYKLYYRNPLMSVCADKYEVRKFVADRVGSEILNDSYGVFDFPNEIPFDLLPNSFVLKDTLGAGGNSVILVRDKNKINKKNIVEKMNEWVNIPSNIKTPGREWVYENKPHRIIVEKLLDGENGDLPDYKFFCFNGEPELLYLMRNYRGHHDKGELGFFDKDFRLLKVRRMDFKPITIQPDRPKNYDEMLNMARVLSAGFPHVRVDFYNLDGHIVFGEMTFFNASGYFQFEPDEFDFELGERFTIPQQHEGGGKT